MELSKDRKKWLYWRVVNTNPLVTISSIDLDKVVLPDVMGDMAELFSQTAGIHFLVPTWNMENADLKPIRDSLKRVSDLLPKHRFIVTAASELEVFRLSSHAIKCMPCNPCIFQDETRWTIQQSGYDVLPKSDAAYNAIFAKFKRHELCAELDNPLFIYGFNVNGDKPDRMEDIKAICPSGVFVNHALNDGDYKLLNEVEIGRVLRNVRTSLCLSEAEGHMRASIQSLLCGVPVVSTPSIGGRDRYYSDDTAVIVEPTSSAVRAGVADLKARNLSPEAVRAATLEMLNFDRRSFIGGVNKIVRRFHGSGAAEITLKPFIGWRFKAKETSEFIEKMLGS